MDPRIQNIVIESYTLVTKMLIHYLIHLDLFIKQFYF